MLSPWKRKYDKPRQCTKKQRHQFADKDLQSQSYGFSSSYVWMWELDHKESRALKNWCFQIVVLEKALESPLESKKIKPVNPNGNKPWICWWSVAQSCPALCDPIDCCLLVFPVLHCLLEFAQTHGDWVSDATYPSHPLPPPSSFAFSLCRR